MIMEKKSSLPKVGLIGWRGMVGRVLLNRMQEEKDFALIDPYFFSTSQAGQASPQVKENIPSLLDAFSINELKEMEIILCTQGSDYTNKVFPQLRQEGWAGYWIDAASSLRMQEDACIVLDPINRNVIEKKLKNGCKNFIGSNCTVAIMLMGIGGLLKQGLVEWVSSMSYQAISGAGAKAMEELLQQMDYLSNNLKQVTFDPILTEKNLKNFINNDTFPKENIGHPLVGSLLPWIDQEVSDGQSREERKGFLEANKILDLNPPLPIDGICVRVPTMRCHSKALTIKLKENLSLEEIKKIILDTHEWVKVIDNKKAETLKELNPYAVSTTLKIHVGRLKKTNLGEKYVNAFVVGDQLLWGAAEPLRRMLLILLRKI